MIPGKGCRSFCNFLIWDLIFLYISCLFCFESHPSQDRQTDGRMDGWMQTHHPAVCSDGRLEHWWASPFPNWGIPLAVCHTCEFWRLRVWVQFHRCSLQKYRFCTVGKFLKVQQTSKQKWNHVAQPWRLTPCCEEIRHATSSGFSCRDICSIINARLIKNRRGG